ncbi:hypothetical protein [Helicobacter vulpis]|uniref:hypothetical protein n=1 Tax=Helicobacter vulpis TaxID=2316076 RepID=UPI000EACA2E8|nr:hypothetical protein [Helicobacter vulpis]
MKGFSAREVVSELGLQVAIKECWDFNIYKKELRSKSVKCDDLLHLWKDNLFSQCKKFSKKIRLEFADRRFLYSNTEIEEHYKAGLVSEIFRNKCIAKNCANLDLHVLQDLLVLRLKVERLNLQ